MAPCPNEALVTTVAVIRRIESPAVRSLRSAIAVARRRLLGLEGLDLRRAALEAHLTLLDDRLSAMEAMAASKPLVSTNVGGLPFLVRDGENGFLVPPAQELALAEAMKRLLDSPAKRTSLELRLLAPSPCLPLNSVETMVRGFAFG